jgi:hypothetical protein
MRLLLAALALLLVAACSPGGTSPSTSAPAPVTDAGTATPSTAPTTSPGPPTSDPGTAVVGPEVIGSSLEGRPLEAWTVGDGPARVYVVGGIHGDERAAAGASPDLLAALAADPPPGVTVRWVIDANPDGTAAGTRDNAAGVDLNRNWPAPDFVAAPSHGPEPLSEPESAALAADLEAFDPVLVVAFHAAREGPFVNYDGPGSEAAHAFAAAASEVGRRWEVVPALAWPTTGSLGTHLSGTLHLPVVTVEPSRWDRPDQVLGEMEAGLRSLLSAVAGPSSPSRASACADHAVGLSCSDLRRSLDGFVGGADVDGSWAFVVKEVGGGVLAARFGDAQFYPASTLKILHAAAVGRAGLEPGTAIATATGCEPPADGPDATVGALVTAMITESDNAAANAIQFHLGADALGAAATEAGMADTHVHHAFGCGGPDNEPANHTTAADLVSLVEGVADGSLGSLPAATALVDVSVLTGAPPGWRVLAKDGFYESVRTVAGVVDVPGPGGTRRIAFAFLATGVGEPVAWTLQGWVAALVETLAAG